MIEITYSILDRNTRIKKTVACINKDSVGQAVEQYISGAQMPQYVAEIGIVIEKVEEIKHG